MEASRFASPAQINTLPAETLTRIFSLAKRYCYRECIHNKTSLYKITAVCSHWRKIATGTPSLWSHIDIGLTVPIELTHLLLERTKDAPFYLHVYEPQPEVPSDLEDFKQLSRYIIPTLKPHIGRVSGLELQSFAYSTKFVGSVLNLWLNYGNPDLARTLLIRRPFFDGILSADEPKPGTRVSHSKQGEKLLLSISTLYTEGTILRWNTNAYRNLKDLRLQFYRCDASVPVSQVADILSTSPSLEVFKLGYLDITHPDGWVYPKPILLNSLKILDLVNVEAASLEILLPLIALPSSPDNLSVAVSLIAELQPNLERFFAGSRMTTIYCYHPNYYLPPKRSLLASLPIVDGVLILKQLLIDQAKIETGPSVVQPTLSYIPNVILTSCEVTLGGLKQFVAEHQVQNLRLQSCYVAPMAIKEWTVESIRDSLAKTCPELNCSVEKDDSTYNHPIREWDPYSW